MAVGATGKRSAGRTAAASDRDGFDQTFERIYRIVLKIPVGRVMTYGQIARLLEDRYSPRLVGWAMHAVPHDQRNIPWHRVINSKGAISTGRVIVHEPNLQRYLLESEGVQFNAKGQCDLAVYQWSPRSRIRSNASAPDSRKKKAAKSLASKPSRKKPATKARPRS
jgi:methylated-DNA-protein-cysteine methyltransferase-like protein